MVFILENKLAKLLHSALVVLDTDAYMVKIQACCLLFAHNGGKKKNKSELRFLSN